MEVSKEEDEPKTPRDKIIDNDTVNAAKTIQKYVREYFKKNTFFLNISNLINYKK